VWLLISTPESRTLFPPALTSATYPLAGSGETDTMYFPSTTLPKVNTPDGSYVAAALLGAKGATSRRSAVSSRTLKFVVGTGFKRSMLRRPNATNSSDPSGGGDFIVYNGGAPSIV